MSFYDLSIKSIDGNKIDFKSFKGKNVLIVNVASYCGFTNQYEDLQVINSFSTITNTIETCFSYQFRSIPQNFPIFLKNSPN